MAEYLPLIVAALIPLAVPVLALAAAGLDAALTARARGTSVAVGAARPLREITRLLRQQRRTVLGADRLLWRIGGVGLIVASFLAVIVVPFGDTVAADLPIGVVWFNTIDVALWALWWMLGWGANGAYALIGGYRFLAQALAYELPLMFALTAPAVAAGSLNVGEVADAQSGLWFVVSMPIAALVYLVSVAAFSAWGPFSPAAGRDLAGGVLGELSGIDRLLVKAGRWCLLVAGSAFAVPMFFGGGAGPLLPEPVWVVIKTVLVLLVLVFAGRAIPAVPPQRLAEIGWVVLVPLTLLQLLITSIVSATGTGGM
ncbi:complex I subunit 1 family protein [Microbacterium sp. SCN 69-37]|mgnify:CR=1 FL=1|uniref:complex I subunit 1 family protein n=1 Tax=Microbacterium sp. SCN 69-37 TaxID=1660115 RepID=UPI000868CF6A|nr:complex I subunit 1 family protein [Microbacterium sp. SCN 69-37]ODT25888.1 MAG: NADH dehydrogenase [Microbacterium sp. SCN 69-37]